MLNKLSFVILGMAVAFFLPVHANANTQALINLQTYSGVASIATSCNTCHTTPPTLNAFGSRFLALGGSKQAYVLSASAQSTLFAEDTDGDGTNNLAELQAGTNPAGGTSTTTASNELAATTGCTTSNLQLPIVFSLVLLGLGLFARRKEVS